MTKQKWNFGSDQKSALEAKYEAQKIAFAPMMFQAALALRDLGILQLIRDRKKEGVSLKEIATTLDLSTYGVKVLLEAGLSLELVWVEEGLFRITKTGWHILKDPLTRVNMDFTQDVNYLGMHSLTESIRQGRPTGLSTLGPWETIYEGLFEMPEKARESWFAFDHYYSDCSFSEILPLVLDPGGKVVLDVGGNTGKFALQCARYDPRAKITILDHPRQVEHALENTGKAGVKGQVDAVGMDLLDHSRAFPHKADVIWMSQFLDCFSTKDVFQLLRRSLDAMKPGADLFIMDLFWDRQKFPASTYSLHASSLYFTNMANGNSQFYHSEDLLELIQEAGLVVEKIIDDIGISHTLIQCKAG